MIANKDGFFGWRCGGDENVLELNTDILATAMIQIGQNTEWSTSEGGIYSM